ncbi:MAG TPA: ABC transporter ATP-binding protein [candidate division WOR-3 bacterium]|uniref:ABC transporter ATP-binding protein n=1 Tax=candidate division WOR-3 bacterium TaxID=2052148 RepID=A0A7C5E775_UNCW3|nr:MAG: macrolide ABC transporter ATP-binding protein [Candidatus Hydrothermae bacterium]HHF57827.1 ABC transporter ATP-binding protein [candidate division WOR-3 bacterium]
MIELKGVKKIYQMDHVKVAALRGIDLKIEEGEYVAIMGPSGSGKSTLMHIIGCLDRPTEGLYIFRNTPVHELTEEKLAEIRRDRVGFVFQNFNLLPRITARENVELPMIYKGIKAKERHQRAVELLRKVGLGARVNHKPTELSGGERQRVAIARALANEPDIILADEPTGNLDTKTEEEILKIFDQLWDEGKTIIVVTHDPEVAAHAKRIIHIRDGKIVD